MDEARGTVAAEEEKAVLQPDSGEEAAPPVERKDAKIYLFLEDADMTCEMQVDPPEGGGRAVTVEAMKAELEKKGVIYGIDREALIRLEAPTYGERVVVARGLPPVPGKDAVCHELFSREPEKTNTTRADGTVDYKELGLVRDLKPGTVVCEITPPTEGVEGLNVFGQPVPALPGKTVLPPIGEHIKLSEDGLKCETLIQGNLVWRNDRFTMETVYRVGNVDYDIGNIRFSGDVYIGGDMMDGFEVHAGGTVTLVGQGGSVVIEAEHIIVEKGINGQGSAQLTARKTMTAGFVENCNVTVGEKLVAKNLINCNVECEGDVEVNTGKGIICGGKVTALGTVKAKEVGNEYNTLTVITLGVTPKMLKDRKRISEQIEDVQKHIEENRKNLKYIEGLVKNNLPVPEDRRQMLKRIQLQLPLSEKKMEQLKRENDELEERLRDVGQAFLTANLIYPPTKVSIGMMSINVMEQKSMCKVFKSEGELVFGRA